MRSPSGIGWGREWPPEPLPQLPVQPPPGQRTGRPGIRLRQRHGCGGGVGEEERGMGSDPPLPALRRTEFQPRGGGRQPHEAHVHCHEAPVPPALSAREDRGAD